MKWIAPLLALTWLPVLQAASPVVSDWRSDFGPVQLSLHHDGSVSGHYPDYRGTLSGRQTPGGALDLLWLQPTSEKKCKSTQMGTRYWGRVTWTPADNDRALVGRWSYCDAPEGSGGTWNAWLLAGQLTPSAAVSAAPAAPAAPTARPTTSDDLWQAVRFEWGQMVIPDMVTVLNADFTCDGVADQLAGNVNLDSPDGPFFDLMVVTDLGPGKGVSAKSLSLSYGQDAQYALCGKPGDKPRLSLETLAQAAVDDMVGKGACRIALVVDNKECDTIRVFWMPELGGMTLHQN